MPVSSIGASLIASAQNVASGGSGSTNSAAAAAQEATETKAQTMKEAQAGDPVARRKLAKMEAQEAQQEEQQSAPSESGTGTSINKVA